MFLKWRERDVRLTSGLNFPIHERGIFPLTPSFTYWTSRNITSISPGQCRTMTLFSFSIVFTSCIWRSGPGKICISLFSFSHSSRNRKSQVGNKTLLGGTQSVSRLKAMVPATQTVNPLQIDEGAVSMCSSWLRTLPLKTKLLGLVFFFSVSGK